MASTYHLFDLAEKVESVSARIYGALAEAFRYDPDVRTLFALLQGEEEQHASRVRLLAAHYRHDPKLPVDADAAALDACLAEAGRALADIRAGAWGRDVEAVKRRLAALEQRLAAAHAHVIAKNASPAVRAFFESLSRQDEAHARLLAPRPGRG